MLIVNSQLQNLDIHLHSRFCSRNLASNTKMQNYEGILLYFMIYTAMLGGYSFVATVTGTNVGIWLPRVN